MTNDKRNLGLAGKHMSTRTEELLAKEMCQARHSEEKAKTAIKQKQAEKRRVESDLKRLRKQRSSLAAQRRHIAKLLTGLEGQSSTDFLRAYSRAYVKNLPSKLARIPGLSKALREDKQRYEAMVREIKMSFARAFRALCAENGLTPTSGDEVNGFRVKGWFRVMPNWVSVATSVSTVNEGHRATIKSLEPEEIVKFLRELADKLFSKPFCPDDFILALFDSYKSVVAAKLGADALLSSLAERINMHTEEFAIDLARLLTSGCKATSDGYVMRLSSGTEGIIVYNEAGQFRTYKFIRFSKEA